MNRPLRITPEQAKAVEEQRVLGRTDRQIERIIGLAHGLLSQPYLVAEDSRPVRLRGAEAFSAGPTQLATIFGRSGADKKGAA